MNKKKSLFFSSLFCGCIFILCCTQKIKVVKVDIDKPPFEKLSEYNFFQGQLADLNPSNRVLPYDLNTPLFTDYAEKLRFVWMPEGKNAKYQKEEVLNLPIGSVLIKNFFYYNDTRDISKGRQIIETRLLVRRKDKWDALTYVWNNEQNEAFLKVVGGNSKVKWTNDLGQQMSVNYQIPNKNQCKGCHEYKGELIPIGPKVRNLNKDYNYLSGEENQLDMWAKIGYLSGYDSTIESPKTADWLNSKEFTLHERAMAYLDINCGHCHNPNGPGGVSGLNLNYNQPIGDQLGICKSPVSAGKGSGGNDFDILPGKPNQSILLYRMKINDPGAMMPEIGRTIVHEEGVQLISDWIASLEGDCGKAIMN